MLIVALGALLSTILPERVSYAALSSWSRNNISDEAVNKNAAPEKESPAYANQQPKQSDWLSSYLSQFEPGTIYTVLIEGYHDGRSYQLFSQPQLLRLEYKKWHQMNQSSCFGISTARIKIEEKRHGWADGSMPTGVNDPLISSNQQYTVLWRIIVDQDNGSIAIESANPYQEGYLLSQQQTPRKWSWKKMKWKEGIWKSTTTFASTEFNSNVQWKPINAKDGWIYLQNKESNWFLSLSKYSLLLADKEQKVRIKIVPFVASPTENEEPSETPADQLVSIEPE